jgi:hypothetical protein
VLRILLLVAEARLVRKRYESFPGVLLRVGHYIQNHRLAMLKGKPEAVEVVEAHPTYGVPSHSRDPSKDSSILSGSYEIFCTVPRHIPLYIFTNIPFLRLVVA